ncbi:MAG: CoA transferase [Bacteroidetes bacterium]|jgi:alpha-methylacyl-CoA racemase|nr:CoA transferase [Bacteroidota bacterium]
MDLLKGIKIIDFTRLLPGPVATHLLAQMGAEIIKIESPKRMDYARQQIGQVDGASVLFHQLNHNKISKIIDYSREEGKAELFEEIKNADAIIEQFRPGAMDAWGFGYKDLKKINPKIVYVSLTGYGQEGEYSNEAGHDFNYLALAGMMSLMKDENGKPIVPDTQYADIGGAYMAVMALQAALLKKCQTGEGSFVDVNLCDAVMPFLAVPYAFHISGLDYRKFNVINGKTAVNYAAYECGDGKWLSVAALELKFWNNICDELNKPEWKRSNQMELMNQAFPKHEIEAHFKTKTRDEWTILFKGKDVCIAPILEIEELEDADYHQGKNNFEEFETSNGTKLKTIGLPFSSK